MLWVLPALGAALALATADALVKKFFSHLSPLQMGYVRLAYSAPWLLPLLLLTPAPHLDSDFWLMLAAVIPLEFLALYLYMDAIRSSPLSLTVPFLSFTPVWMILSGWVLLGELPSRTGAAGILLVAAGAYVLNLDRRRHGLLEPIKAVFREPGSRKMMAVSAIYALTATAGKKLILLSSPTYFGAMYFLTLAALLTPALWSRDRAGFHRVFARPWWGLAVGLSQVVMVLFHVWAITLTQASYMIAVKRLSLVFAVLYGRLVFGEAGFGLRLAGASLMFSGVIVLGAWG
ncbi:MAG: DMT family transporter [Thermodesulfobacteriota bacterium]